MRAHDLDQRARIRCQLVVIGRVVGQVRQLGRVGLSVKELLEAAVGPPDVLEALLDQRQLMVVLVAEDPVHGRPSVAAGDHVSQRWRSTDIRRDLGAGGS